MAASSVTVRPSPIDIARAVGAAVPAEVSAQPLLGILGVVTGAGVVTLTSRMISLGMPDFRGLHGFGYDESAWIGTAFDAGLMFIGPFTVYLGGLMGPRRILLTAAALFTVLLIFLPFAHSYSLVIAMAFLGGLTSGTFYPLTLTFALWLVQKPSFVELDVLEFGAHHAADDDLHLLRDTENQCTEEIRERTELRRVFVRERGPCYVAGRL